MLKSDIKKKFKDLGFDIDKLVAAATHAEEQDFTFPEINNLSDEQLAERDKQVIATAKPEILKEGKQTGIEIANKAIAKKFNLADVDTKDPDKIIAALEGSVAKGDLGLKEQISLLQKDKTRLEADIEQERTIGKQAKQDTDLISYFPAKRTGMTDKEFLALTRMNLSIEDLDGVTVVKKDGAVLRDSKTQSPVPVKDAIANLFTEKKWIAAEGKGGRGGDDQQSSASGLKKFSQVQEQYIKDNPKGSVISPEFQTHVAEVAKATTDFDWDN